MIANTLKIYQYSKRCNVLRVAGQLKALPAGRAGTPDEVCDLAEFLNDGGTTDSYWHGDLQYLKATY